MPRRHQTARLAHYRPSNADPQAELKAMVLTAMIEDLDMEAFINDPSTRLPLREVLESLSDEEFGIFERQYTKRHLPH